MPNFIFPKPQSEDIFEDMVCDIFARRFNNPNLQRYGRKGQSQDGLDITGFAGTDYSSNELVGIQCKNHTVKISSKKLEAEITETLKKFEDSKLPVEKIFFLTSADKDKNVQDSRFIDNKGKSISVEVLFWDYVVQEIEKHPDLLYKYFTKYLPPEKSSDLFIPDLDQTNKKTLKVSHKAFLDEESLKSVKVQLINQINLSLGNIKKTLPYNLYLGITKEKTIDFDGNVDLTVNFSELFESDDKLEENFQQTIDSLKGLVTLLNDNFFSKELILYTEAEISLNFLIGRLLRKYKFNFKIKAREQIWGNEKELLPHVLSEIDEALPVCRLETSKDGVLVFEVREKPSKAIAHTVVENLERLRIDPKIITSYKVNGNKIIHSAHALSVAEEMSKKILRLEAWGCENIHLFFAIPKSLASLIAYSLNTTINSTLFLYFIDNTRTKYLLSGTINNNTFK